jgi:hypothetical protein
MNFERLRRSRVIKRRETDVHRWSQSENLPKRWDKRAPFCAALCAESRCVCDIGCGNQSLRSLLSPRIKYLPADLVRRTDDTAVCNLNKGELPEEYLRQADTAIMLGVIEYVYDVPWVLKSLSSFIETLIVSYNPSDMIDIARDDMGWVNGFSIMELSALLVASGYLIRDVNLVDPGQVIFRAVVEPLP